jgi:DUF1680 family protein
MAVREVVTNSKVQENKNKVALAFGPLVYALEEIDNPQDFDNIKIDKNEVFEVKKEHNLLNGVQTIQTKNMKAIPYYAWSNRGVGKMKVWIDEQP